MNNSLYCSFNGTQWKIRFEIIALVADLPAKCSILNMQQFNAYYGCTLCNVKCQRSSQRKLFYPNERFSMRSTLQHYSYLQRLNETNSASFRGVKGPAKIFQLIPNLPLSAPVDYMHQILLGVARTLFYIIKDAFKRNIANFNASLRCIKVSFLATIMLFFDFAQQCSFSSCLTSLRESCGLWVKLNSSKRTKLKFG